MSAATSQRFNASTPLYGLVGYPLSHSFSPAYFRDKFTSEGISATYSPFPLEDIAQFPSLIKANPDLRGLNVTIPYKQAILPYLDRITEDAEAIGAVNCIACHNGKLVGHNTDWMGFRDSLLPLLAPGRWPALVLGNGGASCAVQYALQQLGIAYTIVSRAAATDVLSYTDISGAMLASHSLIINTTSLGTLGEGIPALPYEALNGGQILYDLVYNPALTPFLAKGLAKGATVKNGLEMLQLQADASWEIWQRQ